VRISADALAQGQGSQWQGKHSAQRKGVLLWVALATLIMIVLFAPLAAPYDPLGEVGASLEAPSPAHLLGTDLVGRDVWSRTLYGGRHTLQIALIALVAAVLPGGVIGLLAGYLGYVVDSLLTIILDALLAIPGIVLALAWIAVVGRGPGQVALAAGAALLPVYARVVRAAARGVRHAPYIEAAVGLGVGWWGVLCRHILPNVRGVLLAEAFVILVWALLNAAALNFLGLGGDPAALEWGAMLADARSVYRAAPWVAAAPGVALTLVLILVGGAAAQAHERQH